MLGRVLVVMCASLMAFALVGCGEAAHGSATSASTGDGEVLFEDDFSAPTSGWRISESGDAVRAYENGVYAITPNEPKGATAWPAPYSFAPVGEDLKDVSVEVDVSATKGSDDFPFGIACRVQDDQNHYTLYISRSGNYGIRKVKNGTEEKWVEYRQQPSAIQGGEVVNHLRAECVGDTLILYVNDDELLRLRDDEFSSGGVGLSTGVATSNRPGANVLFDNFVVRQAGPLNSASAAQDAPPSEGQIVNEDDFSDPTSGWEIGSESFGSARYADGAYQLSGTPGLNTTATHLGTLADTSVEADVTHLEGPRNSALTINCRATSKKNAAEKDAKYLNYQFYATGSGVMGIGRRKADNTLEPLALASNIGPVHLGKGETNRLRADCVGQKLILSVNGEKWLEVEDDAISTAGGVGFGVDGGTQSEPVVAQFDNFVLRKP